jgi:DNA-binding protein YbaB
LPSFIGSAKSVVGSVQILGQQSLIQLTIRNKKLDAKDLLLLRDLVVALPDLVGIC